MPDFFDRAVRELRCAREHCNDHATKIHIDNVIRYLTEREDDVAPAA